MKSDSAVFQFIKNSKIKKKLQFTGWLQYIIPIFFSMVSLIISGLLSLASFFNPFFLYAAYVFLSVSSLLFIIALFDIIILKFNIRPQERLPKRRDDMDAFDLMRARRSCRSFQNRKLKPSDRKEILTVVKKVKNNKIGNAKIRLEYINARLTVWPAVNAQEFFVAIAPKTYNRQSVIDVGRNLQKVVHHATKMGLATCWIGPGADHTSITKKLGKKFNPSKDHIICVCAIGYKSWFKPFFIRIASILTHNRLPISSLFFTDLQLKKPLNEKVPPFDHFGRCYEVCQWAPSSFNAQPTRCVAVITKRKKTKRVKRFDFYATTKSRYYAPVALGIWCANWEIGCEALDIKGHFEILSKNVNSKSAKYGVSWILEKAK